MISHRYLFRSFTVLAVIILLGFLPGVASADIAPPQTPPGANLSPGSANTRVRMVAETVTLAVKETPARGSLGQAQVTAVFDMLNTGNADESMQVRFPLTFADGRSDGWGNFPEIAGVQVKVDGRSVATRRVEEVNSSDLYNDPVPWAAFEMTFPAGKTVQVEVNYLAEAWGEMPFIVFGYVLETGTGWHDTIGSADLIVRLPYEANTQNVVIAGEQGFGDTSPGAEIAGSELRWHFTELEPDREDNLTVTLISPVVWKKILVEREAVSRNPQDGEAWGRLGKACKESIRQRRGVRQDPGGQALFQEGLAAYERSVSLLPDDSLWHLGFAELLWEQYLSHDYRTFAHDQSLLVRAVQELITSLDLDPGNALALELANEIGWMVDGIIDSESDPIDFLVLTATPVYPTQVPTLDLSTATSAPEIKATGVPPTTAATATVADSEPTLTLVAIAQSSSNDTEPILPENETKQTGVQINLCGAIFVPLFGVAVVLVARRRD